MEYRNACVAALPGVSLLPTISSLLWIPFASLWEPPGADIGHATRCGVKERVAAAPGIDETGNVPVIVDSSRLLLLAADRAEVLQSELGGVDDSNAKQEKAGCQDSPSDRRA